MIPEPCDHSDEMVCVSYTPIAGDRRREHYLACSGCGLDYAQLLEIPYRIVFEGDAVFSRQTPERSGEVRETRLEHVTDGAGRLVAEIVILRLRDEDGNERLVTGRGDETVLVLAAAHEENRKAWKAKEIERYRREFAEEKLVLERLDSPSSPARAFR